MKQLVILIFGLAFTSAGAIWGYKRWQLRRTGTRTMGKVVEISVTMGIPKGYYPIVEFKNDAGREIRFRGSTGTESYSPYQQGQVVKVIYSRQDPRNAQIDNFGQFWLGPVSLGIFGLIVLGAFVFGKF